MAEYRMLPLWTDALLGDTQHLNAAEFGAYMLMLIVAWRSPDCCLPNDTKYLSAITRSGPGWKKIRAAVMPFWTLGEDGKLTQKRLSAERRKSFEFREQQKAAGKASALKRKERASTPVPTTVATPVQRPLPSGYNRTPTSVSVSVKKEEESVPPPSLVPGDGGGDGRLLKSADELRARLEEQLNLGVPVIRAPIVTWMQAGATTELIEATIADVLTRKPDGWKPDGIGYFGKAILRAVETAKADAHQPDQQSGELSDKDAKRMAMKAKADLIAKGHYLSTVGVDDIRGMIHLGWLTKQQAQSAGYAP